MIVLGAAANTILGTGVHFLRVPLFFDSIFTIVVAIHVGIVPGILTAVLTNGTLALTGQVLFPFVLCNIATALIAGLFRRHGGLETHTGYLWMGIVVGFANGVLGSVIAYFVFHGITAVHGIDRLVMAVVTTGQSLLTAVFWAGMLTNVLDKLLSAIAAFFLRISAERLLQKPVIPSKGE